MLDLNNKSILITGGTGSLGKELTKTILTKWPEIKRLVCATPHSCHQRS